MDTGKQTVVSKSAYRWETYGNGTIVAGDWLDHFNTCCQVSLKIVARKGAFPLSVNCQSGTA